MRFTLRLAITTVVCVVAMVGAWWWITTDQVQRLNRELAALQSEMTARLAERDAMIDRLGRERRIGRIEVLGQSLSERGEVVDTRIRFIELDDGGHELGRMEATVPGAVLFVDALTVRFDPQLVAEGSPMRGRTLVLLRRLYSDRMRPVDGIPIDTPGAVPDGYAGTDRARYEQSLWTRFWAIATDPKVARDMGVRVAQGEAVYQPMRTGQAFDLRVEAVGGMTLAAAAE